MTKKSQTEMNISQGYSIRPLKIKLYTYEILGNILHFSKNIEVEKLPNYCI